MRSPSTRGVSLIEMLVYISILLLLALAAIYSLFSLRDTFERNRVERELTDAATTALERMGHEIRDADQVGLGSVLGTSPGTLVLDSLDPASSVSFYLTGDTLMISENGTEIGALTPEGVSVDALRFWHQTQANSMTDLVRVGLTLSVDTKFASTTKTFYTSAVLRGSYE